MSKNIYSYIRKEYEDYKHYSDSTIKKLLPNWCSILKSVQNDVKKEYEEKLRWIPIEEKLPENKELVLVKTNRNCVSTAYLHGKLSGFITYGEEAFVDFGSITHWRSIFL